MAKSTIIALWVFFFITGNNFCFAEDDSSTYQQMKQLLDSKIDLMTYDDAIVALGSPTEVTQGDTIFIATWVMTSSRNYYKDVDPNSLIGLTPEQIMEIARIRNSAPAIKQVDTMQLIFGKGSRKLRQWSYKSQ